MTCKHCGKEIEPSHSPLVLSPAYRHSEGKMFACFNDDGKPMKNKSGKYKIATPQIKAGRDREGESARF